MTKKEFELPSQSQTEVLDFSLTLNKFFVRSGLQDLRAKVEKTRNGSPVLVITLGLQETKVDLSSGLDRIVKGDNSLLFKLITRCFSESQGNVTSVDLLNKAEFASSCLGEIAGKSKTLNLQGNVILNRLVGSQTDEIPVLYGSTSGLNLAEIFETVVCAQKARVFGINTRVVFDSTGNDSQKAKQIFDDSFKALPKSMHQEFSDFVSSLGSSWMERRVKAAMDLVGNMPISSVTAESIIDAMGEEFSLAKLALIAKLAGEDPLLFENIRTSSLINRLTLNSLSQSVSSFSQTQKPAGFTYYAREAVLGADVSGTVILPFKLTTHANIYKVLGRFKSLCSQRADGGVILCPIVRQRIQTREQARFTTDPCDVMIVAFLASQFPEGFSRLIQDFAQTCKVLSPEEAIREGTKDNRFVIEDYFPIANYDG